MITVDTSLPLRTRFMKHEPYSLEDDLDFGKYRGQTIQDTIMENVDYISWLIDNINGFELDNQAYQVYIAYLENKE